jgi:hypothetical protein
MVEYEYRVVVISRDFEVMKKMFSKANPANIVAKYFAKVIGENTGEGWEFYRVDTINLVEAPGCLAALFGQRETMTTYNVMTFRRLK